MASSMPNFRFLPKHQDIIKASIYQSHLQPFNSKYDSVIIEVLHNADGTVPRTSRFFCVNLEDLSTLSRSAMEQLCPDKENEIPVLTRELRNKAFVALEDRFLDRLHRVKHFRLFALLCKGMFVTL